MTVQRLVVLMVTTVALAACGGSQAGDGTTTTSDTTEQPDAAAQPEPAAPDGGATTASADGAALVAERCTVCHDMAPIDHEIAEHADRDEWLNVVNDMISRGARLSEQERDTVVDYLASR